MQARTPWRFEVYTTYENLLDSGSKPPCCAASASSAPPHATLLLVVTAAWRMFARDGLPGFVLYRPKHASDCEPLRVGVRWWLCDLRVTSRPIVSRHKPPSPELNRLEYWEPVGKPRGRLARSGRPRRPLTGACACSDGMSPGPRGASQRTRRARRRARPRSAQTHT
jgi:hypothetical protein